MLTSTSGYHVRALMVTFPNLLPNAEGHMNFKCWESFYADGRTVLVHLSYHGCTEDRKYLLAFILVSGRCRPGSPEKGV